MSIQEARRVAFEEWWESEMNLQEMDLHRCEFPMQKPDFVQPYACHETQRAFLAWNASLSSVVIELPGCLDEAPYPCYEGGWNDMHCDARDLITAAGIRVEVKS